MENYQEKARENFYRNRPYGIHIDYARKGFVLFNHYTNSLGKQETVLLKAFLEKFGGCGRDTIERENYKKW